MTSKLNMEGIDYATASPQHKLKVCSLFSGIGGIDLGFIQAGFKIVWANEIDKDTVKTYKYNFGSEYLLEKDIRKVDTAEIPDFDVLVAGFPCQPFSVLGKQKGFEDPRGQLFFEITRIVRDKQPQVVFLENVANLLEHDDGKTFLTVYNALVPYGYTLKYRVIDAIDYGNIPQHRTRIFIVAFLDPEMSERFTFPEPIKRTKKLNDILSRVQKHSPMYYLSKDNISNDLVKKFAADKYALCQYRESSRSYSMHRVCPTLVASMGDFPERIPVIQDSFGIRRVTPYECLALLGFPTDFRFPNISMASAYKQCGNSVAVPVIHRIAENIMKAIQDD